MTGLALLTVVFLGAGTPPDPARATGLPAASGYHLVGRFSALPAYIREGFITVFAEREARLPADSRRTARAESLIAEPGMPFQTTDIFERGKPQRRLLFAALGEEPFVLYEHGGMGLHLHALFLVHKGQAFRVSRNLVVSPDAGAQAPSSVEQLWRALAVAPATRATPGDV